MPGARARSRTVRGGISGRKGRLQVRIFCQHLVSSKLLPASQDIMLDAQADRDCELNPRQWGTQMKEAARAGEPRGASPCSPALLDMPLSPLTAYVYCRSR